MRFVYGINPVLEALRAHPDQVARVLLERGPGGRRAPGPQRVADEAARARVRVEDAAAGELQARAQGGVHQGVGAELADFAYAELLDLIEAARGAGQPAFLLALDGVTDPQNLGALARSAHALGAHGLVLPKDRSAKVTPAAAKAAAGALERCPIAQVTNLSRALEEMKEAGLWIVGLAAEGDRPLAAVDLRSPLALVLGSEGKGLRPLVRKHCDHLARIEMAGALGSLNVAAAGAIALYEAARQRRGAGASGTPPA